MRLPSGCTCHWVPEAPTLWMHLPSKVLFVSLSPILFTAYRHLQSLRIGAADLPSHLQAEMAFEATTIHELVLSLIWACLSTTPANQKNALFAQAITSHLILEELALQRQWSSLPVLSRPSKLLYLLLSSTSGVYQRILPSAGRFIFLYSRNLVVDPKSISGVRQRAVIVSIIGSTITASRPRCRCRSEKLLTKAIR